MDETLQISLHFDQYSRYRSAAEAVALLSEPGDTVLDVGSGQTCVLGGFLPDRDVTYLDPLLETRAAVAGDPHYIARPLEQLDPHERRFDVVVCVDTLEHVPPEQREAFLQRLASFANKGLVLSMPCRDVGDALEVDEEVNAVYRKRTGEDYPWLREHFEYGLPPLAEVRGQLSRLGWETAVMGNGHGPWLKELLAWVTSIIDEPAGHRVVEKLSLEYNRALYRYDHLSPCYRQVVLAQKSEPPSLPEHLRETDALRAEAQDAWREFHRAMIARISEAFLAVLHHNDELEELAPIRHKLHVAEAKVEEMTRSKSWKLTVPLRGAMHLGRIVRRRGPRATKRAIKRAIERTGRFVYRHVPMPDRVRWALTRCFFVLFGRLLRTSGAYHAYRQELMWRRRAQSPVRPARKLEGFARPETDKPDCIFWGVIDWHFRFQRPQHLAKGLAAKGHRVFYISPQFANNPYRPFVVERLDVHGEVHQVRLGVSPPPRIYDGEPADAQARATREALRHLLGAADVRRAVSVVQHPGWRQLAYQVPDSRIVYDCMDHHHGFSQAAESLGPSERDLVRTADLVVGSSSWLYDRLSARNPNTVLVRNACEPGHFAEAPGKVHIASKGRKTIGYYGAIAEWFDAELVYEVARAFPDCRILLVRADTAGVVSSLSDCPNVESHGEVPYDELPAYLHGMDVCLIPFQLIELTHATNPVKIYEYLAAGKPVVTTDLPELRHPEMQPLIYRARNQGEFLSGVRSALAEAPDAPVRRKRRAFALSQTWDQRVEKLEDAVEALTDPLVSVIVVTWNNLEVTRACIESLFEWSDYENFELIVVDNASADETPEYLRTLEAERENVRVILNDENRGFAPANNQGLEIARGDYLVLLNNDTKVTPGWLRTLAGHLRRRPGIGALGPVTNNIGNEARVVTEYETDEELLAEARRRSQRHAGKVFDIPVAAFFCVAFPREVYEQVGPLDENYEVGFFEDDDYCQRIRQLGKRVCCAEDVFIHHELSASFSKVSDAERREVFERNRAYYESKWGEWTRHRYRPADDAEDAAETREA